MALVEINYTQEGCAFRVELRGEDIAFFEDAGRDPTINDKKGEALVGSLLARAKGEISEISRYKDGKLHNGPNGEPSCVKFSDTGWISEAWSCNASNPGGRFLNIKEIEAYMPVDYGQIGNRWSKLSLAAGSECSLSERDRGHGDGSFFAGGAGPWPLTLLAEPRKDEGLHDLGAARCPACQLRENIESFA